MKAAILSYFVHLENAQTIKNVKFFEPLF